MAAVVLPVFAATPAGPPALPMERDCTRWEAPRHTAFDRVALDRTSSERADERGPLPPGAFVDRAANLDPSLHTALRRPTSVELLLCEQLNVKDKLDYLIRRLGR